MKQNILLPLLLFLIVSGCGNLSNPEGTINTSDEEVEREFGVYDWPSNEIGKSIPVPESNLGSFKWEDEYSFMIYIGETSKEDYDTYVEKCEENGFVIDYWKGETNFFGYNEDNYYLSIDYQENDYIMTILAIKDDTRKDDEDNIEEAEKVNDKNDNDGNDGTKEKDAEILTVETCPELEDLLTTDAEIDPLYSEFAEKYKGLTISFDGCITYVSNHENYDTRYDILMYGGDYTDDETVNSGPLFKFEDVAMYNLGIDDLFLADFVRAGTDIHITATIQSFNEETGMFYLKPVSIEER